MADVNFNALRVREKYSRGFGEPNREYYPACDPVMSIPTTFNGWQPHLKKGESYKYICDVKDGIRYQFNPCFQERWTQKLSELLVPYIDIPGQVTFSSDEALTLEECRTVCLGALSAEFLDDFSAKAEQSLISAFPDGASVINMIIEVIQMIEGNIKVLKHYVGIIKDAITHFFRYLRDHPGQWWVAWRFAIRPTLHDVEKLLNGIAYAMRALKYLRKVNHQDTVRHYGQTAYDMVNMSPHLVAFGWQMMEGPWDAYPEDPEQLPTYPAGAPGPAGLCILPTYSKIDLRATGVVRFDINDAYIADTAAAIAMAWSEMQWLYNPWEIVWEATPFSWLIDWFLSEKAKLERWKQELETSSPYGYGALKASCWSAKGYMEFQVVLVDNYLSPGPPYTILGNGRYRWYDRRLGLPDMGSSPFRLPVSWYPTSIIASILSARILRRNSWR